MTIDDIKALPGVTASIAAGPNMGWPERGLTLWGSDECAITCHYDPGDIAKARFTSWTHKQFHNCPTASWPDWVKLAETILVVEAARQRTLKQGIT